MEVNIICNFFTLSPVSPFRKGETISLQTKQRQAHLKKVSG